MNSISADVGIKRAGNDKPRSCELYTTTKYSFSPELHRTRTFIVRFQLSSGSVLLLFGQAKAK